MNNILENKRVKINKIILKPSEATGHHFHDYDYIIIPMTDGNLVSVNAKHKKTKFTMEKGVPYFRKAGVEHNVINTGENILEFIEIELLKDEK